MKMNNILWFCVFFVLSKQIVTGNRKLLLPINRDPASTLGRMQKFDFKQEIRQCYQIPLNISEKMNPQGKKDVALAVMNNISLPTINQRLDILAQPYGSQERVDHKLKLAMTIDHIGSVLRGLELENHRAYIARNTIRHQNVYSAAFWCCCFPSYQEYIADKHLRESLDKFKSDMAIFLK